MSSKLLEIANKLGNKAPEVIIAKTSADKILESNPRFKAALQYQVPVTPFLTHFEKTITDDTGASKRVTVPALCTAFMFQGGVLLSEARAHLGERVDSVSVGLMSTPIKVDDLSQEPLKNSKGEWELELGENGKASQPTLNAYFPLYWTYARNTGALRGDRTLLVSWNFRNRKGVPGQASVNAGTKRTNWNPDWVKIGAGTEKQIKHVIIAHKMFESPELDAIVAAIPEDSSQQGGGRAQTNQSTTGRSVTAAAESVPESTL